MRIGRTIRVSIQLLPIMLAAAGCAGLLASQNAHAHCQIPCGIYGDHMRFDMLKEHITTIEKSMRQIKELAKDPIGNANQLTRWIMNKEDHADEFAGIITQYFLQQRIKPLGQGPDNEEEYHLKVSLCHEMLVTVMKTKQTTDLNETKKLSELVEKFRQAYFSEEELEHVDHEHSGEGS